MLRLRLMETSDLHMFVYAYDYYRDMEDNSVGLTRVATLARAARAEVPNSLMFDNGDIIQGNPLGDYIAQPGHLPSHGAHPMLRAMGQLGYDAATLGNHEFNYGLPFLEAALKGAEFPFVCANVEHMDGSPLVPRTAILERDLVDEAGVTHRLRIGVIGFAPPQITVWDATHLTGKIRVEDIVDSARRYVPALRAQCDLVVALSHSGISAQPRVGGEENASLYLAEVPGIDVIFTGHAHRQFPGKDYAGLPGVDAVAGTLFGKPAVMPGFWGSHLGLVDLVLRRDGTTWAIESFKTELRPIGIRKGGTTTALAQDDAATRDAIKPQHEATIAWMAQPVGVTSAPITTYFAFLGPDPSLALVNAAQLWYTRPLLRDTVAAGLPLLSAAAPFNAGGMGQGSFVDIATGPLTMKDIAGIYVFANTISVVRCSGSEVCEWLERSAIIFNTITPGKTEPQALLGAHRPTYNFDVIAGLTYEIDVTQPPRYGAEGDVINAGSHRIGKVLFNGKPIDPQQSFAVITNNYRAGGGGHFPGTGTDRTVLNAPDGNRDALLRYVTDRKTIAPDATPVWRFAAPSAPTVVTVDLPSSARALAAGRSDVREIGPGDSGRVRFALTLGA